MARQQRNKNSLPSNKRDNAGNGKSGGGRVVIIKGGLITKHHIIPLSRGGIDDDSNKCNVPDYFHKRYHGLFTEMTPLEALAFLETNFWGGDPSFIDGYSKNRSKIFKKEGE